MGSNSSQGGVDFQYSEDWGIARLALYANSANPSVWEWGYGDGSQMQMTLNESNVLHLWSGNGHAVISLDPEWGRSDWR